MSLDLSEAGCQMEDATPKVWPLFAAVLFICMFLNITPRMIGPSGQNWFTLSVPQPQRFIGYDNQNPSARLNRGFPFTFFTTFGSEFITKERSRLFLMASQQPKLIDRISFGMLFVNMATSTAIATIIVIVRRWAESHNRER